MKEALQALSAQLRGEEDPDEKSQRKSSEILHVHHTGLDVKVKVTQCTCTKCICSCTCTMYVYMYMYMYSTGHVELILERRVRAIVLASLKV